jgi:hypothetical protein
MVMTLAVVAALLHLLKSGNVTLNKRLSVFGTGERLNMLYLCDNQHPQIAHTEGGDCPLCLAETRWVEVSLKFEDYKAEEEMRRELDNKEKKL